VRKGRNGREGKERKGEGALFAHHLCKILDLPLQVSQTPNNAKLQTKKLTKFKQCLIFVFSYAGMKTTSSLILHNSAGSLQKGYFYILS
jgi:hypothetical protein